MRTQVITVSDETFTRLKAHAEPFVDHGPEDVIKRLLDEREANTTEVLVALKSTESPPRTGASATTDHALPRRMPRQRGVTVMLGDKQIEAETVRDLYLQTLQYLVENHLEILTRTTPLNTSSQRYLVAKKDTHPTDQPFVVPVEYEGFFMEAHKDYKNGISHLRKLARRLGLPFECVE